MDVGGAAPPSAPPAAPPAAACFLDNDARSFLTCRDFLVMEDALVDLDDDAPVVPTVVLAAAVLLPPPILFKMSCAS